MLAKIMVKIDIKTQEITFSLPDFNLEHKRTIIEKHVWRAIKDNINPNNETWGMINLGFKDMGKKEKTDGKIELLALNDFCPYDIDLEYYKDARKQFTTAEWIDVLLGAIDYNPNGYKNEEEKLTLLTRLLPFVEKNLNLIELAPKGTGKSYVFGNLSRYGWIATGSTITRAKMFYDMNKGPGYVFGHDFVTLDEIQSVTFSNNDEMRTILKGYLENDGIFTVGTQELHADAGLILCGNIDAGTMEADATVDMFTELPESFHESALIDRFAGFIKGWKIPRMNEDMKVSGWALNTEYFCSILHEMRTDTAYRAVVDKLVIVPPGADTRDTKRVKAIATAYLKLLFPNVRTPKDISARDFKRYCLKRAVNMRQTIRMQLAIIDAKEFGGKNVPDFKVNEDECGG
jgi:ATP-dependent Lon protease